MGATGVRPPSLEVRHVGHGPDPIYWALAMRRGEERVRRATVLEACTATAAFALAAAATISACGTSHEGAGDQQELAARVPAPADLVAESPEAAAIIEDIRSRFRVEEQEPAPGGDPPADPVTRLRPVLKDAVADGYQHQGSWLRAQLPSRAWRGVIHRARVLLPSRVGGSFRLRDNDSGMEIMVSLEGVDGEVQGEVADGYVVYRSAAPGGGHVVHRVHAEGTEDYLTFEQEPEVAEVTYRVGLGPTVAGLRLVENVLEFLDEGGAPRLRMASPYLADAEGVRHEARITVEGCAYDEDARAPWRRPVVATGAARCGILVGWDSRDLPSPVMLDPSWTATASMASGCGVGSTLCLKTTRTFDL